MDSSFHRSGNAPRVDLFCGLVSRPVLWQGLLPVVTAARPVVA